MRVQKLHWSVRVYLTLSQNYNPHPPPNANFNWFRDEGYLGICTFQKLPEKLSSSAIVEKHSPRPREPNALGAGTVEAARAAPSGREVNGAKSAQGCEHTEALSASINLLHPAGGCQTQGTAAKGAVRWS